MRETKKAKHLTEKCPRCEGLGVDPVVTGDCPRCNGEGCVTIREEAL